MKRALEKNILLMVPLMALCLAISIDAANCPASTDCTVAPMISIRSQGVDRVHQMVESVGHVNHPYELQWYSSLSAMLVYEKSFNPNKLTECLFGSALECVPGCDNKVIRIQGSNFLGDARDPKALLADYFYLPLDFESTVAFEPTIRSVMVDLDYYLDLSDYSSGLYFRAHAPLVHTTWKLGMCETIIATGTLGYPHGYFTAGDLPRSSLLSGFTAYAHGCAPSDVTQNSLAAPFTDSRDRVDFITAGFTYTFTPPTSTSFAGLGFGKMNSNSEENCNNDSKTGVAEVRLEVGKRFFDTEDHHFGIDIQCAIPTGSRPNSTILFSPQIGNGNHWELGVGLNGHWNFWQSEDESGWAGLYVDANITHVFSAHQVRTFDLKNKPLSRYELAMRFTPAVNPLLQLHTAVHLPDGATVIFPGHTPDAQFTGEYAPVANLTTLNVNVSATIQADIVAMVNVTKNDWSLDIGYNFWGRSCEKISCGDAGCCPNSESLSLPDQANRWALKGDARVYGYNVAFGVVGSPPPLSITAVPLSATEHCATIHEGTNQAILDYFWPSDSNRNIDNPQSNPSYTRNTIFLDNGSLITDPSRPINTSIEPVFLEANDIDLVGTRGISNKVFAHLSRTNHYSTWRLHYGIGGSAEFGLTDKCCDTDSNCDSDDVCASSCINCAVSLWSVWGKVGIDFN
jgi:hypothetical protein